MAREKTPTKGEILKLVTAYFHALPPEVRKVLKKLRTDVHAAVPGGEQGFSYRIPCVRLEDRPVVWYAGFKNHVSVYPMTAPIVRAHAAALSGYETSKGTIRFPLAKPPSLALVKNLVKSRLAEMRKERGKK
jgi:uncharacterized protein YdhG (YjbR/CyaY superfamily)